MRGAASVDTGAAFLVSFGIFAPAYPIRLVPSVQTADPDHPPLAGAWKTLLLLTFPIQYLLVHWFTEHPDWIERGYLPYVFRPVTGLLRLLLGWIPLSVGQLLLAGFIFWACYRLGRFLSRLFRRQLRWEAVLFSLLPAAVLIYILYMVLWGLCYHRVPLATRLQLDTGQVTQAELVRLAERLTEQTRRARRRGDPSAYPKVHPEVLYERAHLGFAQLARRQSGFEYRLTSLKTGLGASLLSYLNIAGFYLPLTGEGVVNPYVHPQRLPFVITHEMAHQLGYASEEEANYLGYLACRHHPDPLFRYAGFYGMLFYTLETIALVDPVAYERLLARVDPAIMQERAAEIRFWQRYYLPIQAVTTGWLYDRFLKLNGQASGVQSYGQVVELLVGEMRREQVMLPGKK